MGQSLDFIIDVKRIDNFLAKFGFITNVTHSIFTNQTTYEIQSDDTVVFTGDHKGFREFIFTLSVSYDRMMKTEVLYDHHKPKYVN